MGKGKPGGKGIAGQRKMEMQAKRKH